MATRNTIIRGSLTVALLVLAGILGWVAWTKVSTGQGGAELVLPIAVLPLVAAGLLFLRRNGGGLLAVIAGTLATFAALLGALVGLALSYCLFCSPQPPLSGESIALWIVAVVVLALAVADLAAVGLVWVAIAIAVLVLVFAAGPLGLIAGGLLAAAVAAWWILKRRRSGSGSSANAR